MTTQVAEGYKPEFTFADRLRRIRRDHDLTQDEFAELLGVGSKRYAAWESETNTPRFDVVVHLTNRIVELYGVEVRDWLLGFTAPEPSPTPPGITTEPKDPDAAIADLAARRRGRRGSEVTGRYLAPGRLAA
jgi:transcriptional regulator with XRE-family HTH domain